MLDDPQLPALDEPDRALGNPSCLQITVATGVVMELYETCHRPLKNISGRPEEVPLKLPYLFMRMAPCSTQTPLLQIFPKGQAFPQAPQLVALLDRSSHCPAQTDSLAVLQ